MLGFILFLAAPNTAYRRAAIPHLKERFADEWAHIWRATCRWQSRLAPSRPHQALGIRQTMPETLLENGQINGTACAGWRRTNEK